MTDPSPSATLLGIDPGAGGALAWVSPDGRLIAVVDMPIIEVRGKKRVCAASLAALLSKPPVARVVIEGVGGMPGQGVGSTFAFGYAAGLCEGVAAGAGLPMEIVQASVWKHRAGVSSDKGVARHMASRLWPAALSKFSTSIHPSAMTPRQSNGIARVALAVAFAERNRLATELDNNASADPAAKQAAADDVMRCRLDMQQASMLPGINPVNERAERTLDAASACLCPGCTCCAHHAGAPGAEGRQL